MLPNTYSRNTYYYLYRCHYLQKCCYLDDENQDGSTGAVSGDGNQGIYNPGNGGGQGTDTNNGGGQNTGGGQNNVGDPNLTNNYVSRGCGHRNRDGIGFRIKGAEKGEANFGEFPWMIALIAKSLINNQYMDSYVCGGSLVHRRIVLTAAHCVFK